MSAQSKLDCLKRSRKLISSVVQELDRREKTCNTCQLKHKVNWQEEQAALSLLSIHDKILKMEVNSEIFNENSSSFEYKVDRYLSKSERLRTAKSLLETVYTELDMTKHECELCSRTNFANWQEAKLAVSLESAIEKLKRMENSNTILGTSLDFDPRRA